MGFFTKSQLLRFRSLNETMIMQDSLRGMKGGMEMKFDFFLSHSSKDKEYVEGFASLLKEKGKKSYCDWIYDADLSRDDVTEEIAERLRIRMQNSQVLIFLTSDNSPDSKWMPWELGYFDGFMKDRVYIMPITESSDDNFDGQEYLKLYKKVKDGKEDILFGHKTMNELFSTID